jgi:hypothetical protein
MPVGYLGRAYPDPALLQGVTSMSATDHRPLGIGPREPTDAAIAAAILALLAARAGTICPSEAARALAADWRPLMADVRRVAADLARARRLVATQRGRPVDPRAARGPIRLGRPPGCLAGGADGAGDGTL